MSARSKTQERRVARYFGVERTPLSGGASRHTRSDTLHPDLFIEVKSAIGPGGTNGWLFRWLRRLDWRDGCWRLERTRPLSYLVHSACLGSGVDGAVDDIPSGLISLSCSVHRLAREEHKMALLALLVKGKRGFWLVGDGESILEAQKARKAVVEHEQTEAT